jgi:signal transduction histidine kinase
MAHVAEKAADIAEQLNDGAAQLPASDAAPRLTGQLAEIATRDEFLHIVSHDLRGPLMTIAGVNALIAQNAPGGDAGANIRDWTETIKRSVGVMERLIRDLLDFGSLQSGRLRLASGPHDMREVIVTIVEAFEPVAAAKSVAIAADLPADPVVALFDQHRIHQVLSNLVHNAVKFTPSGGSIRVRAHSRDAECLVAVADTGIGIPKRELRSIFERFRQLDSADRTGVGLGLYISMWIVEAHGGRIWAESNLGDGTTFYFTLPTTR